MKNLSVFYLLCIFYFFTPNYSYSQVLVTDSTKTTNVNGIFYDNHYMIYDNAESDFKVSILGDTLQVFQLYKDKTLTVSSTMSTDARAVSGFKSKITELIRQDNAIETLLGAKYSPLKSITSDYSNILMDSARIWVIDTTTITFSINGQGQLKYKTSLVGSTNKNAFMLGSIIRLTNYSGTNNIDLYKDVKGNFTTLDGTVSMKSVKSGKKKKLPLSNPNFDNNFIILNIGNDEEVKMISTNSTKKVYVGKTEKSTYTLTIKDN